jgi:hypothetical protein
MMVGGLSINYVTWEGVKTRVYRGICMVLRYNG